MLDQKQKIEKFKQELLKTEFVPCGWRIIKSENLGKEKIPESEFLIEKLVPKGGIIVVAGNPSSGKSWFLMEMAKCLASNRKFLDKFETKEANVLYVDEENTFSEIKRRWAMLDPAYMTLTDFMALQGIRIDDPENLKGLIDLAEYRNYNVIIFDALADLHQKNENSAQEMSALMNSFREFTRKGITVILCHHLRKENYFLSQDPGQLLRGSTVLLGGIDSLISVENTKRTDNLLELLISQPKLRQGKPNSQFKIRIMEIEGKMKFEYGAEVEDDDRKVERAKEIILNLLSAGKELCRGDLIQRMIPLYFSEASIDRAIKELKENKELNLRKEGKFTFFSKK
jgi:RecA-family ATPase